jgi:hypothetical protein
MLRRLSAGRPTHATIVAYLALFVALGGGAYAAAKIGSGGIQNNAILSRHIKGGEVKSSDIAPNSMGSAKVPKDSLTGSDINESTLGQVPLAALAGAAGNANHATNADQAVDAAHSTNSDQASNATHSTNSDQLGGLGSSSFFPAGNVRKLNIDKTGCATIQCLDTPLDLGSFKLKTVCIATGGGGSGARLDVVVDATGTNARVDWMNVVTPSGGTAAVTNGQVGAGGGTTLFSVSAATSSSTKFSGTIVYRDDASVVSVPVGGNVTHVASFNASCQLEGTATKAPA